jgi:CRISPR type I-E-associated protein CasB/Cse2
MTTTTITPATENTPTPREKALERAEAFVRAVAEECKATRRKAVLKRGAGGTLAEAGRDAYWLYGLLGRFGNGPREEERLFLVASLLAHDRDTLDHYARTGDLPEGAPKNVAATLDAVERGEDPAAHEARRRLSPDPNRRVSSIERRLRLLLDARAEPDGTGEQPFRLFQAVKYVLSKEGGRIHWPQLLVDLRRWDHPDKLAQKEWARTFYGYERPAPAPAEAAIDAAEFDDATE